MVRMVAIGAALFMCALSAVFARGAYYVKTDPVPAFVSDDASNLSVETVECMYLKPDLRYIEAGDTHCVINATVHIRQVSSNFYDYAYARKPENNAVEGVMARFLDSDGRRLLSVPCVVTGSDMMWGMDGVRLVQFTCSFIMTHGRLEYLLGRACKVCFADSRGNLLDQSGKPIEYTLSDEDIEKLRNLMSLVKRNIG